MNKRKIRAALALTLLLALVTLNCKGESGPKAGTMKKPAAGEGPREFRVLCSFLPIWIFTRNVVGDRPGVTVNVLIPGSQGPHDYQLSPNDMLRINDADLFIINGLHLDDFIANTARKVRPGLKIVAAADAVTPIYVSAEGYWKPEGGDDEDEDVNPHAFASPGDAAKMVSRIGEALAEADPAGAEVYRQNARAYSQQLTSLADRFRAVVKAAPNKNIVTFHNAFDYLARDAGLVIAGVIETAPGQEPSAQDLARLIQNIKDSHAAAVFSEPQFSPRLAQVVAKEAGVNLFILDPVATGEQDPGYYMAAMKKNLEALKTALAGKAAP
jgi:zinc transport system substrate-binding protein